MDAIHRGIEMGALGIGSLAVAIILIATTHGTIGFIVIVLAVRVVVRTFLSWSLVVEIEGYWPWKR